MARLLYEALARGITPDYVRQLLNEFPLGDPDQAGSSRAQARNLEPVEPLSARELEVLQLVAEGLPNQAIASMLFVPLNTVKVHTRNIYGKLGIHNRTKAVAQSE